MTEPRDPGTHETDATDVSPSIGSPGGGAAVGPAAQSASSVPDAVPGPAGQSGASDPAGSSGYAASWTPGPPTPQWPQPATAAVTTALAHSSAEPAPGVRSRSASPEVRLLRRTRRQLVLWSAGSTLLVLLVLSAALYVALARQLANSSIDQLQRRADFATSVAQRPFTRPGGGRNAFDFGQAPDPGSPGIIFGGPYAGTAALTIAPGVDIPSTYPFDPAGVAAARSGLTTIDETVVQDVPLRILSTPVVLTGQTFVVQVIGDRTNELQTLQVTLIVLAVGGLIVLLAAASLGWVYAGRALVPIRESLRRQREFAADASHELRTPLTVIKGNVRLLRSRADKSSAEHEELDDIEAEVTRMTSLVEQLLLLARTDSDALALELGPTDLAEEAADALEAFTPVAEAKGVQLQLDIEPAPMTGDRSRLRQLTGILVDNAVRHSPRNGKVTVKVREAGGRAVLSVEDEGSGIRQQDLPRVFDRFWRAPDAPPGGSGLGLAIAQWIVERHGGRIRAENRSTGGARFTADLPAS